MRIAIMLRALDELGGIGVYTRYLTEELLAVDHDNEYVLLYRSPVHLGRFADRENVTEVLLRAPGKALWDQVAVPLACRRQKVDVVLHPKFSVPLLAPAPTVMVLHGADWLVPEQARFYTASDVAYQRLMLPVYCRRAAAILSVSELTTQNVNRALGLPEGLVRTVYFGPARHFRRVEDPERLQAVRDRYDLPERFIFTLSKVRGGERKNVRAVLDAYRLLHPRTPHRLVIGGKDCHLFREEYGIPSHGWGADVLFPGWIAQEDLPAVYTLADLYLYPSNLEAFPIPLTEAMACGTPIVTSDVNGLREIAGDAALRVDPSDPVEICEAAYRVLTSVELREELAAQGLERSKRFSWERCARETLEILKSVAA
ncbi:MAG: glycosyltransferase family 4 protein [Gemmatimonadota bacterium]